MNILAFDTSTSACSVALYFENQKSGSKTLSLHEVAPMQHTSMILPMIQSLLDSAGITQADLGAIAFGCGPGSFTGIRIAASLAQGLAYAGELPVIPVSSLAAAAQAAYQQHGWKKLLVAVDARMGQIYWAMYTVENNMVLPSGAEVLTTPDAIAPVTENDWYGIGDGWNTYRTQLIAHLGREPRSVDKDAVPTAEAVLILARERFNKGEWVTAAQAMPVYLR